MQGGQIGGKPGQQRGMAGIGQSQPQPGVPQNGLGGGGLTGLDQRRCQPRRALAGLRRRNGEIGDDGGRVIANRNILLAPRPQAVQPGPVGAGGKKCLILGELSVTSPQSGPDHQIKRHWPCRGGESFRQRPILGLHCQIGGGIGRCRGILRVQRTGTAKTQNQQFQRGTHEA